MGGSGSVGGADGGGTRGLPGLAKPFMERWFGDSMAAVLPLGEKADSAVVLSASAAGRFFRCFPTALASAASYVRLGVLGSDDCAADQAKCGCRSGVEEDAGKGSEGSGAVYVSAARRGVDVADTMPAEPRRSPAMVESSDGAVRE